MRFCDRKIIGKENVDAVGEELFSIVDNDQRKDILMNFDGVEFISSALLNKLIQLDKRIKGDQGRLRLFNLRAEILELFNITRLNRVFDIKQSEAEALEAFGIST